MGTAAEGGGTAEGAARAARWGRTGAARLRPELGARAGEAAGAEAGVREADFAGDPPRGAFGGPLRSGEQVCKLKPSGERRGGRDPAVL